MKKFLVAAALLLGATLSGHAHATCPSINPNLTAPPFVDGCPLPAAGLNNITQQGGSPATYSELSVQKSLSGVLLPSMLDSEVAPLTSFSITGDTAAASNAGIAPLALLHEYGGGTDAVNCNFTTHLCSHFGLWSYLLKTAATKGAGFDTGIFSNVQANVAGTLDTGAWVQSLYGYAAQVSDKGGEYYGVTDAEFDINLQANTDNIKEGVGIGSVPLAGANDLYQGVNYSAGLGVWAGGSCGSGSLAGGSGCAGFNTGISFGRSDSYWPISDHGTMIGVTLGVGASDKVKADYGIDLSLVNVSFCAFKSLGFCVEGNGNVLQAPPSSSLPTSIWEDASISTPKTQGGYMRLTSNGAATDAWLFQINTAADGAFGTGVTPIAFGIGTGTGAVVLTGKVTVAASGAGSASNYVCADSSNNIVIQAGAC